MPLPVRSLPVLQNWDCHGCTDCCREFRVQVTDEEKSRIDNQNWDADPAMQGVKRFARDGGWFSSQYRLNHQADGSCVFLDPKGGCRIHAKFGSEAKPLACRIYPFVLAPSGDHWRVGLRFACPSVTNDLGRPAAAHERELREYAAALEKRERFAERSLSVPMLKRAQTVPWPDLLIFIKAFHGFVLDERRPLEWRLRHMLATIDVCRQSRFDLISGDRLKEFLSVIGDGVAPDVPARPEAVAPPSWVGRVLFRQTMAINARRDSGPHQGISRRGRLALLWAALKFAHGVGTVPRPPCAGSANDVREDRATRGPAISRRLEDADALLSSENRLGDNFSARPISTGNSGTDWSR